jgi:hypothetical protein
MVYRKPKKLTKKQKMLKELLKKRCKQPPVAGKQRDLFKEKLKKSRNLKKKKGIEV